VTEPTDAELLRRYSRQGDEAAFTTLGRRYERLVYTICYREVGRADLAADAAQETFLLLARSARSLSQTKQATLAGWLFAAARNVARNLRRSEGRRNNYEQEAGVVELQDRDEEASRLWERVEPQLHEALAGLRPADRDALLLRYFEQRSLVEVGVGLGVSENAAQMRVSRALDRLRERLTRLGIVVSVALLATLLEQNAAVAAPADFGARLAQVARQGRSEATPMAPLLPSRLPLYLVAGLLGVGLAASLAWLRRTPVPAGSQVDTARLAALERFYGGVWKGQEFDAAGKPTPVTLSISLALDGQRLTYRYDYPAPRDSEQGRLTVERRTGRVVVEGRDVYRAVGPQNETLRLEGWQRSNTDTEIVWTFARQTWAQQGNTLTGALEAGSPPALRRTWKLTRSR
jgi:RNA polymerase sigma factor (sigma-70 family)